MAIGGFDGTTYLKTIEVYDPETNSWKLCGGMNYRRLGGGVGVVRMPQNESHLWWSVAVSRNVYQTNMNCFNQVFDSHIIRLTVHIATKRSYLSVDLFSYFVDEFQKHFVVLFDFRWNYVRCNFLLLNNRTSMTAKLPVMCFMVQFFLNMHFICISKCILNINVNIFSLYDIWYTVTCVTAVWHMFLAQLA